MSQDITPGVPISPCTRMWVGGAEKTNGQKVLEFFSTCREKNEDCSVFWLNNSPT